MCRNMKLREIELIFRLWPSLKSRITSKYLNQYTFNAAEQPAVMHCQASCWCDTPHISGRTCLAGSFQPCFFFYDLELLRLCRGSSGIYHVFLILYLTLVLWRCSYLKGCEMNLLKLMHNWNGNKISKWIENVWNVLNWRNVHWPVSCVGRLRRVTSVGLLTSGTKDRQSTTW